MKIELLITIMKVCNVWFIALTLNNLM